MSKSDLLGSGAAFSNARRSAGRSERGRAKAIAQGDVPAYELIRVPLDQVSATPLNPRRNFGTDEEKTRFGEELREAQLAACVVVHRDAYLGLWPDHASGIGTASYVLINGERRFRSALHVGLDALDFVVRDDLAASRTDFIDHLLSENLDREDFDVIERARGVAQLVETCAEQKEHGSKARAAERLKKSPGWVTQQLALLDLPVQIQLLLSSGELPERDGRALVRELKSNPALGPEELLDLLKESKDQQARVKDEQQSILRAAAQTASEVAEAQDVPPAASPADEQPGTSQAGSFTAVKTSGKPQPVAEARPGATSPVMQVVGPAVSPVVTEVEDTKYLSLGPGTLTRADREVEPAIPTQSRPAALLELAWQEPRVVLEAICANMTPKDRAELTMMLIERQTPRAR